MAKQTPAKPATKKPAGKPNPFAKKESGGKPAAKEAPMKKKAGC